MSSARRRAGSPRARLSSARRCARPNSTDLWREREQALAPAAIAAALEGVTLIVAENENEEALALAIAMREALETPGKTRRADHARSVDRAARRGRAGALGRRGRGFRRPDARPDGGRRACAAHPRRRDRRSRRARFSALIAHPQRASAAPGARAEAAARALELGIFRAAPLGARSTISTRPSPPPAQAARGPPRAPGDRASARATRQAAEALMRDCRGRSRRLRAFALAPASREFVAPHRAAILAATRRRPEARRRTRRARVARALMDEWREAAATDLLVLARRIRRALRGRARRACARRRRRGGHPRLADPRPARGAPALSFDRVARSPASTRRFGRRRSRRTPSSTGRCAPSSGSRRRSGASGRPRMTSSRRSARARRSLRAPRSAAASRPSPRASCSASARRQARAASRCGSGARASAISAIARGARPAGRDSRRASARAATAGRAAPARSERDAHRDPAARPLRHLRRADPASCSRSRRSSAELGAARDRRRLARGAAGISRGLPVRRRCPPAARDRLVRARARAFCAAARRSRLRGAWLAQYREGARLRARFRAPGARRDERIWVEQRRRDRHSACERRIVQAHARAPTASTRCSTGERALIDYKSGPPPGAKEVKVGFAPQLTLEAAILVRGGFRGPAEAASRRERSISSSAARRAARSAAPAAKTLTSPSSPNSISPNSKRCSNHSPSQRRPISRARSRNSRAASRTTTISRE